MRKIKLLLILCFLSVVHLHFVNAEEPPVTRPEISVAKSIEEGKSVLVATIKLGEEPLKGVQVAFFVQRRFGLISLGKDETLEDGTAAVPFPDGLPGDANGGLRIVAEIVAPSQYSSLQSVVTVDGGVRTKFEEEPFPRALWAPKAPRPLIGTIVVLLAGVWGTYFFVIVQLVKIKKGEKF